MQLLICGCVELWMCGGVGVCIDGVVELWSCEVMK